MYLTAVSISVYLLKYYRNIAPEATLEGNKLLLQPLFQPRSRGRWMLLYNCLCLLLIGSHATVGMSDSCWND